MFLVFLVFLVYLAQFLVVTQTFLAGICSNNICICIDNNLLETVADDLLLFEKIQKYCLVKLTGCKLLVNGGHC